MMDRWTRGAALLGVGLAAVILPVDAVGGWGVVRDTVRVLLATTPDASRVDDLMATLEVAGVRRVRGVHVWTLGSDPPALPSM
jgi:Co/Zn/Cd efflux system component